MLRHLNLFHCVCMIYIIHICSSFLLIFYYIRNHKLRFAQESYFNKSCNGSEFIVEILINPKESGYDKSGLVSVSQVRS